MISEQINLCDVVIFILSALYIFMHSLLLCASQAVFSIIYWTSGKKAISNEFETEKKCGKLAFATPPLKCLEMKHSQQTKKNARI